MLKIKDKAKELGVSVATLRRWHKKGLLLPDFITFGGHRRYQAEIITENRQVIGYSRVSSSDQKEDLTRQSTLLQQAGVDKVIDDVGSGFPLFEQLCSHFDVKLTVLRQQEALSFENQLVQDLISIITVFSTKLYGKRSHANKKAII